MKISHRWRSRKIRFAGFSLIELMISLTIGLIISIAAMSAYLGSSTASKAAAAQSRMDEDGQAALKLLSQQIRLAGSNPVQSGRTVDYRRNPVYATAYQGGASSPYTTTLPTFTPTSYALSQFAIRGCDGTFTNIATATTLDGLSCPGTATASPDSIAISYEADIYDTVKTSTGAATDCVGGGISNVTASGALVATFAVADNRFYIANSTTGIPNLYCKGITNATAQPLIENIEDMQIRYGSVSATATLSTDPIAGYRDAVDIEPTGTTLSAAAAAWGRILTVRICVVMRSADPVLTDAGSGSEQYYKCDGTLDTSKTDLRLRRAYSTTIALRNRKT